MMWRNYTGTFLPKRALKDPSHSTDPIDSSYLSDSKHFNCGSLSSSAEALDASISYLPPIASTGSPKHQKRYDSHLEDLTKGRIDLRLGSGQSVKTIEQINQSLIRVNSANSSPSFQRRPPTHSASSFSILSEKRKSAQSQRVPKESGTEEQRYKSPQISGTFVRKHHRGSLPPPLSASLSDTSLLNDSVLNLAELKSPTITHLSDSPTHPVNSPTTPLPTAATQFTAAKSKSNIEKANIPIPKMNTAKISNQSMFDVSNKSERPPPEMPKTDGIEYPRAASWSSSTVAEILRDPIGIF